MKIYSRHYCEKKHRNYHTQAKCIWKWAVWITGDGPYACLAWCPAGGSRRSSDLTIELHPTLESAEKAKAYIDKFWCGGNCSNRHEIIKIEM